MLEVGNPGLSVPEARTHFALWCLVKSPLLIGADLSKITPPYLEILKNKHLIAINQSPDGRAQWTSSTESRGLPPQCVCC